MLDGPAVAEAFAELAITHALWIPDSHTGAWEEALSASSAFRLVRVCREGEAFAVAAGLLLGGMRPVVILQCTGLFEAGDALRNAVHDLKLPLFFVVGLRNSRALKEGRTTDTAASFVEPLLRVWGISWTVLEPPGAAEALKSAYRRARREQRAWAALVPE